MITLYTWPTPNGQKVQILLEEVGVDYRAVPVNILRGEQFTTQFATISSNNKIPVITDDDVMVFGNPISIFETGAMMIYLAEKYHCFLPSDAAKRADVLQWHLFQSASLGPMLGQVTHFRRYAREDVGYALDRYSREATRLYTVVNNRLTRTEWLGGADYSIADMGAFPWLCRHRRQGLTIGNFPAVESWLKRMAVRPAVRIAMDLLKDVAREIPLDDEAHGHLFGHDKPSPSTPSLRGVEP